VKVAKVKAVKKEKKPAKVAKKAAGPATVTRTITSFGAQSDYFSLNKHHEHHGLATKLIHAGNEPGNEFGGVSPVLDMSTTFVQNAPGVPRSVFDYARCGNPTRLAFERNLAAMEGGNYALAFNAGMAATVTLFNTLT